MRNLDGSEWLASPNLSEVKAVTSGGVDQANVFTLSVQQVVPSSETPEGVKK
jgi:type IV pilus assembly protein PilN